MDVSFFEESPRLKFNQVLRQVQSIHTVTEELVNELQTTVEEGKFTVDRSKVRPPEWHDWAKANHPQQDHHQPLRGPRNRHRRINLQTPPHAPSQQEERRDRDRHPGGTVPRQSEVSCNSTSARTTSKTSTWSRSTRPLSEGTNTARIPLWATLRWVFISVMPMLMLCKSIRVIYYFHLAAVAVAVAVAVAARMASLSPHPFQLVSPMVGSCHHCRGSASMRFPVPVNELLAALQKTVTLVLPHYRAQKKALELKKRMSKRRVQ